MKIYDNSNLAESYSGVTTPLTYSFARLVYREVYKHFCRMMGVRKSVIRWNESMFESMVVFIGYRMYYDLIHWHKLVSFLPGYKYNREFFEKMLGVAKKYRGLKMDSPNFLQRYFLLFPRLLLQTAKILYAFFFMRRMIRTFNGYFDDIFTGINRIDLQTLDLKELRGLFLSLMKKFLYPWRIPIANDFAVMVSTGITSRLSARWMDEANVYPYLHAEAHRSLVTLDPGYELLTMAETIRRDPVMNGIFAREADPAEIYQLLQNRYRDHAVTRRIHAYISRYGDRPPNELKLETETILENPEMLIALLVNLSGGIDSVKPENVHRPGRQIFDLQRLNFFKRVCIRFLLRWTRNSIERREETRFRRALIFGFARRIFLTIGKKFHAAGWLSHPRDIFYLQLDEIFECIQGPTSPKGLQDLTAKRKREMHRWESSDLPGRIETCDPIETIEKQLKDAGGTENSDVAAILKGMVVARTDRNEIAGTALVLREFDSGAEFGGKILVTRQTDPGWTIVFPSLAALVVERGGMLSHAAIVARELGIPCIVGVDKAVSHIRNGARIVLDLDKGEVYVANNGQ